MFSLELALVDIVLSINVNQKLSFFYYCLNLLKPKQNFIIFKKIQNSPLL